MQSPFFLFMQVTILFFYSLTKLGSGMTTEEALLSFYVCYMRTRAHTHIYVYTEFMYALTVALILPKGIIMLLDKLKLNKR